MIELKIVIFELDGIFHAQTDVDIDPKNTIKGKGKDPYEAIAKWFEDLQEQEYFRSD